LPSHVQIRNERLRQLCDWGLREGILAKTEPFQVLLEHAEETWPFLTAETHKSYVIAALRTLRLRARAEAARVQASETPPS